MLSRSRMRARSGCGGFFLRRRGRRCRRRRRDRAPEFSAPKQLRPGQLAFAAADDVDPGKAREHVLLDRLRPDAAEDERAAGIALLQRLHRQDGERQQVRHAREADDRRGVFEEIEKCVEVERIVGGAGLVIAEIHLEAGVLQRAGEIQAAERHVQLALDLLAVAHEEHVQVDQRDVGHSPFLLTLPSSL